MRKSAEMAVMLNPGAEYRRRRLSTQAGWPRALARPAFVALLVGAVTVMMATGTALPVFVASNVLCWSFAPLLQTLTAIALIASARPHAQLRMSSALDLWFLGHAPWSLWLLLIGGLGLLQPTFNLELVVASGIVPSIWTSRIGMAFCREVLGLRRSAARTRVLLHQAATWILILAYIEWATQLSVRIAGAFEP